MWSEIATIVSSVCGVIIMSGGVARMLMNRWFKQQSEIKKLEKLNKTLELQGIRDMIEDLKAKLQSFENKMDVIHGKLKSNSDTAERVVQAQIAFVASVEKRLKMFEEQIDYGKVTTRGS